jgi:hypothetical protein
MGERLRRETPVWKALLALVFLVRALVLWRA